MKLKAIRLLLLSMAAVLLVACVGDAGLLPDIEDTVEARLAEERAAEATLEARVKNMVEATLVAAPTPTSTPTPTPVPTPTPTPSPVPTATSTPIATPTQVAPTPVPTHARATLTLVGTTAVPDGQIWSGPVWDGQHIVVTYARQQVLWARRYDRNLNPVSDAVRVTLGADPAATDHKHIFLNGMHFVAYSTPGAAELYLLKLDSDLNRLGFVPVVEGTTRERTNDMLLGTDGQHLIVGRFCPCKEAGTGHVFTVFDQNLIRVGTEVDLLEPHHTNMASITFADGAYHILSFRRVGGSDQSSPSSLLQFDVNPVSLTALGQGNIVKKHNTEFYHASTGLVYDSTRQVYYGGYVRGPNMWGAGTVVVEVFDAQSWESLASIDVAGGNRPHLALVDADTLVVGWDEPGVNLGVVVLSTTTTAVPTPTPSPLPASLSFVPWYPRFHKPPTPVLALPTVGM